MSSTRDHEISIFFFRLKEIYIHAAAVKTIDRGPLCAFGGLCAVSQCVNRCQKGKDCKRAYVSLKVAEFVGIYG